MCSLSWVRYPLAPGTSRQGIRHSNYHLWIPSRINPHCFEIDSKATYSLYEPTQKKKTPRFERLRPCLLPLKKCVSIEVKKKKPQLQQKETERIQTAWSRALPGAVPPDEKERPVSCYRISKSLWKNLADPRNQNRDEWILFFFISRSYREKNIVFEIWYFKCGRGKRSTPRLDPSLLPEE